jgi:hypothetical protein
MVRSSPQAPPDVSYDMLAQQSWALIRETSPLQGARSPLEIADGQVRFSPISERSL